MSNRLEVNEGEDVVFRVAGGDSERATAVRVYLTWNTASAADVDLAKGSSETVAGGLPNVGLRFPLEIKWKKGEVSTKTIRLPVKRDSAIEGDELFALQLGSPTDMALAEDRTCMVTIKDPDYDELRNKVATDKATKAEFMTWTRLQAAQAPYICGLADQADAGKVTGGGFCPVGKRVTLKATANKGFVFTGWVSSQIALDGARLEPNGVDYIATTPTLVVDRSAKPVANSKTSTTLTGVSEDAVYYACFITEDEDRAAISLVAADDAIRRVDENPPYKVWTVYCGVAVNWPVASSGISATTVKVTGLPAGLKFTDKDIVDFKTKAVLVPANTIYGAPTSASRFDAKLGMPKPSEVKFTVTTEDKTVGTFIVDVVVLPLPDWAYGTFSGVVEDENGEMGLATATVAANGKASGKVSLRGTNWTFKADSYAVAEYPPSDIASPIKFILNAVANAGKEASPLTLEVSSCALGQAAVGSQTYSGGAELVNGIAECSFNGGAATLWRGIWKDKASAVFAKETISQFEGVYTVSLAPGEDYGSGYLWLTVGKDGGVKAAGKLADGTSVSAASPLMYDPFEGWFAMLYAAPSAYKGGCFALGIGFGHGRRLDGLGTMDIAQWTSKNPEATGRRGAGFARTPSFAGAYYDKTQKLNDFYSKLAFTAEPPKLNGALPKNAVSVTVFVEDKNKIVINRGSGLSLLQGILPRLVHG